MIDKADDIPLVGGSEPNGLTLVVPRLHQSLGGVCIEVLLCK